MKYIRRSFGVLLAVLLVCVTCISAFAMNAEDIDFDHVCIISASALSTSGFITAIDDCSDYVVQRANDSYYQVPEWLRDTFEQSGWEMYVLDDTAQYGYPVCAGLTVYTEKCIYIANIADAATVKTIEHELGHFLDQYLCLEYGYNNFDGCCTFSAEFHEIYYEECPTFVEHYNYPHAGDGFSDFWAECFYEYLNNPYELQDTCPRAFRYMYDIIADYTGIDPFEGFPYNGLYDANGKLTYYKEGLVDKSFTGFVTYNDDNEKYYISNGYVNKQNNILLDNNTGNWYYILDGKVQSNYTGVSDCCNDYGWWYIKNGKVDFSFDGVSSNKYGTWYVKDGKVNFNYNGLSNYADSNGNWWYFRGGEAQNNVNDIAQNDYGWWYIENGKVNFGYTGVGNFSNQYGWWYINSGKVDFGKTSIESNQYGWWRVLNGKVDFTCNSIEQNDYGWWYLTDGKVCFDYTGVANYANAYGWWYINQGKVDFSFNGKASNNYGVWNITNGKVNFS